MADQETLDLNLEPEPTPEPKAGPKRVLVLGGSGMLGQEVVREFASRGWTVASPNHIDLDVLYRPHLEALVKGIYGDYDWLVNCTGYTAVDKAEQETMAAFQLNAVTPGALAFAAKERGWRMLHVSTDYVFDGEKGSPYTEDDAPNPLQVYGKSKREGEQNCLEALPGCVVARTAWLFGQGGPSFPAKMIELWQAGGPLRVVDDQTGTPTYAPDLSAIFAEIVARDLEGGVVHAAGPDVMSWHHFARLTLEAYEAAGEGRAVEVEAVTTAEMPRPARRPRNSALACQKLESLGIGPMRPISEALQHFVGVRKQGAEAPRPGDLA
ncbi:MAG: dTDP-4-dehydrorhamnose reductase [Fimbriimonadaceae bacterium]|nr:dTDP-4-dehydrorhamnose reductase [Fimbriimonadaceae bacterium]QYK55294.1 MAG: dTDP-4-dehydrorhamnose reductase [Fimbriimonadaceae bacterium]